MSKPVMPYIRFFPSDWLSDEGLRLVSFAARGLWMDLLCFMAKSEPRGHLTLNGGLNPSLAEVARLVASTELEITPLIDELKRTGVCSVSSSGVLFSRRMVRDSDAYCQAVKTGKMGGNPKLKKDKGGLKGGLKDKDKAGDNLIASNLASGFSLLISEMKAEPAYAGINIAQEADKALVWTKANRREFTKRFFVNWLNKADKPIQGAPAVGTAEFRFNDAVARSDAAMRQFRVAAP